MGRWLFSAELVLSDVEDFPCRKEQRGFRGGFVKREGERKGSMSCVASCAVDSFPPLDFLHQLYSLAAAPERCRGSVRQ